MIPALQVTDEQPKEKSTLVPAFQVTEEQYKELAAYAAEFDLTAEDIFESWVGEILDSLEAKLFVLERRARGEEEIEWDEDLLKESPLMQASKEMYDAYRAKLAQEANSVQAVQPVQGAQTPPSLQTVQPVQSAQNNGLDECNVGPLVADREDANQVSSSDECNSHVEKK